MKYNKYKNVLFIHKYMHVEMHIWLIHAFYLYMFSNIAKVS